jgi:hypothetical protein
VNVKLNVKIANVMEIKTLEVSGFIGCLESLRLPFKLNPRSELYFVHLVRVLEKGAKKYAPFN